ncbi:MAG: polysaccharide pyruvyl transferase family protein [Thermogutta sp.]
MMILLHGTGTYNKGAELMAVAVLQHYRAMPQPPEFAVPPRFGSYRDRARYSLWTLLEERRFGRAKLITLFAHAPFRRKYGLASEKDITAVVDASGFAFGDQHGPRPTEDMARNCRRWKRQGKKLVLLPQAFGPFSSHEIRSALCELIEHCDLVFAREETSYQALVEVVGSDERIRVAPDFTVSLKGQIPDGFEADPSTAFVVPNQRMLDKTDAHTKATYIPSLAKAIDYLASAGLRPVVLLHAPEDAALVGPIAEAAATRFDVLQITCPLHLKGVLGTARLVIGSRFHALVGALSQAVPTLACGWSHKYNELMQQFDCPQCLVHVTNGDELREKVAALVDPAHREQLVTRLRAAGERLRAQINAMWAAVDAVLEFTKTPVDGGNGR